MSSSWRTTFTDMFFRLIRFTFVGSFTALCYFSCLYIFLMILGFAHIVASCAAYLLAMVINYTLHYVWTFRSDERHKNAIRRYLVMFAVGFLINFTILQSGMNADKSNFLLVQLLAIFIIVVWNFCVGSFWVYRAK